MVTLFAKNDYLLFMKYRNLISSRQLDLYDLLLFVQTQKFYFCVRIFIRKHLAVLSAYSLSNSMLYFTYFTWFKWSIPRVQTTCTKEPSITLPVQVPQTQTQLPHLLSHYYYSFKLNPTRLVSLFRSFIKQ